MHTDDEQIEMPLDGLRQTLRRNPSYSDRVLLDGSVLCIVPGCEASVVNRPDGGGYECRAGHSAKAIVQAFFAECDAEWAELDRDEGEHDHLRGLVIQSLEPVREPIVIVDKWEANKPDKSPRWPTGLEGEPTRLAYFKGVVFLTGGPSAGKSWWAIASSLQAAQAGWRVLYLASEMHEKAVMERAQRYMAGQTPEGWDIVKVDYGATVRALVGRVAEAIDGRNLLVVLDSINSFVDQAVVADDGSDVHRIGPLKRLVMWALNVRRNTEGRVSFLVLSEKNASGETKGRFGDHKADMVCTIQIDEDADLVRNLAVIKSWHSETGKLGTFGLNPRTARLTKIGD